jgi:ABC-type Co2+ transport system permease subunit
MHIEPGYIAPMKVMAANAAAVAVLAWYARGLIRRPFDAVKTLLAATFFSLFMQSFHMSVGPSELHFIGATAMYLTLGFLPTLLGFSLGLLAQGLLFEPGDLPHLAVNSLSLILPLVVMHKGLGHRLFEAGSGLRLSWANILKLDAIYYSGVTLMVGFWLLIGEVQTPLSAWAAFASSYLAVVAIEPLVSYTIVRAAKRFEDSTLIQRLFEVRRLTLA